MTQLIVGRRLVFKTWKGVRIAYLAKNTFLSVGPRLVVAVAFNSCPVTVGPTRKWRSGNMKQTCSTNPSLLISMFDYSLKTVAIAFMLCVRLRRESANIRVPPEIPANPNHNTTAAIPSQQLFHSSSSSHPPPYHLLYIQPVLLMRR